MGDYLNNALKSAFGLGNPRIDSSVTAPLTPVSNSTTLLTDLMSVDLSGLEEGFLQGGLPAVTQGIRILAGGTFATNGNVKTVTLLFGSATLATLTGTFSNKTWRFDSVVLRLTNLTQTANTITFEDTNVASSTVSPTEDVDDAIIVKVQAQSGTASGDITQNFLTIINI